MSPPNPDEGNAEPGGPPSIDVAEYESPFVALALWHRYQIDACEDAVRSAEAYRALFPGHERLVTRLVRSWRTSEPQETWVRVEQAVASPVRRLTRRATAAASNPRLWRPGMTTVLVVLVLAVAAALIIITDHENRDLSLRLARLEAHSLQPQAGTPSRAESALAESRRLDASEPAAIAAWLERVKKMTGDDNRSPSPALVRLRDEARHWRKILAKIEDRAAHAVEARADGLDTGSSH